MTSGPPVKRLRQSLLSFTATGSSESRASNTTNSDEPGQSNSHSREVTAVDATNAEGHTSQTVCSAEVTVAMDNDGADVVSSSLAKLALELEGGAFQPMDASECDIPDQTCGDKTRRFQTAWFQRYPWLHLSMCLKAAVCYPCAKGHSLGLLTLSTKNEDTFITKGFTNWKKALEKFKEHQKSACHRHAVLQLQQVKSGPVTAQLSSQKASEQESARAALLSVFSSIRYLARQGLAIPGHEE